MNSPQISDSPRLPGILRLPLVAVPAPLRSALISRSLNSLFATHVQEGELDFLQGRQINIDIEDAGLQFSLRLEQQHLRADRPSARPDLRISGKLYAFLLLAAREEDADTLFFRREIKTQGDTELGLYVKNFLDGLELETLPGSRQLDRLIRGALKLANLPKPGLPLPRAIQQKLGA